MTLEQLRIFLAVAERMHVTGAARQLHMTQSAVSAAIAALESRHGVQLFHRVGRRIELSDAGRSLVNEARSLLGHAAALSLMLDELADEERGTLRLHASQTIASYWLPPRIVHYKALYPRVDVRLEIGNTSETEEAVVEGEAHLGFVEGPTHAPRLKSQVLAHDTLIVIVATTHLWAREGALSPSRLPETEWILREAGSGTRAEFERALARWSISPSSLRVILELPSNESVCAAVEAGTGAGCLSATAAERGLQMGRLHRVGIEFPPRDFRLIRHGDRHLPRAAEAFIDAVTGEAP